MGRNGGGWAHYVGQEKCRPITGWATLAMATDWSRPPRQMTGTAYWYVHTDQWRYDGYAADALASPAGHGACSPACTPPTCSPSRCAHGLDAVLPAVRPQPARPRRRGGRAPASRPRRLRRRAAGQRRPAARRRGPGRPGELAAGPDASGGPTCSARRARATSTSCKHLLGTDNNLRADETPPRRSGRRTSPGATTGARGQARPAGVARLPDDLDDAALRRRAAGGHLVREARPVAAPTCTRSCTRSPRRSTRRGRRAADFDGVPAPSREASRALARRAPRRPQGRRARCRCSTTPRARWPARVDAATTGGHGRGRRCPGKTMPHARRRRARLRRRSPTSGARSGPLVETARADHRRASPSMPDRRGRPTWPPRTASCAAARRDGRPALDDRREDGRDDPGAVRHHQRPARRRGLPGPGEAHRQAAGRPGRGHEDKQITFADTQARPVPVITCPEWSGSRRPAAGATRRSPSTSSELKPWHTLTGRQHFFLDHDWIDELGEELPIYRPPLDMTRLFGEPALGRPGRARRLTRALPDPALEVVDPLRVPGQPVHALAVARRADDLDEPGGRRQDRRRGQRLDRGGQPQRRRRGPRDRRRTGCPRASCTCTTRRTARSTCR